MIIIHNIIMITNKYQYKQKCCRLSIYLPAYLLNVKQSDKLHISFFNFKLKGFFPTYVYTGLDILVFKI